MAKGAEKKTGIEVELTRDLKLLDVSMLGVVPMISGAIFVLLGFGVGLAGPAVLLALALNSIVSFLAAISYAELASTLPSAGGGYSWVKEGLPKPFGFLSGWSSWFGHLAACGLYAITFGSYFSWVFARAGVEIPGLSFEGIKILFAVLIVLIMLGVNYAGLETTGNVQNYLTFFIISILALFVGFGAWVMVNQPNPGKNFFPFLPSGWERVIFAMGLTFVAFQGYEIIAHAGEEVKNPKVNMPKAIFLSLGIVVTLYFAVFVIAIGSASSLTILSEKGELAILESAIQLLPSLAYFLLIAGFASTASALNSTIFSSSRVSFAMGRDANLPRVLGTMHSKYRVPHASFVFSGILIFLLMSLPLEILALSASMSFLLVFLFVNTSLLLLRKKYTGIDRGFSTPLFPLVPLAGIASEVFLAFYLFNYINPLGQEFGQISWVIVGLWIGLGLTVYYIYRGRKEIAEIPEVKRVELLDILSQARTEVDKKRYRVFLPLRDLDQPELVEFGALVAKERDGELSLLNIVEIPKSLPPKAIRFSYVDERIKGLERMEKMARKEEVDTRAVVKIGHKVYEIILDTIKEEEVNLLVMGWRGERPASDKRILGSNIDYLIEKAPCDIVVFKTKGMKERLEKILVPSSQSLHSEDAIDLATLLGKKHGAHMSILTVVEDKMKEELDLRAAQKLVDSCRNSKVRYDRNIVYAKSTLETVVEASKQFDLLVLGTSSYPPVKRRAFGALEESIARKAFCPVLIVRKALAVPLAA